jgi:hypothetical protein
MDHFKPQSDAKYAVFCQRRPKLLLIAVAVILVIVGVAIGITVNGNAAKGSNGSESDSVAATAVAKYMSPTWTVGSCGETDALSEPYPHVISQCFCRNDSDGVVHMKEDLGNNLIIHPAVLAQYGYLHDLSWLYLPSDSILSSKHLSVPGDLPSCDSASLSLLWLAANILGTVGIDKSTRAGTQTNVDGVVQLKRRDTLNNEETQHQLVSSEEAVVAVQSDWTQRFALAVLGISTRMNKLESGGEK